MKKEINTEERISQCSDHYEGPNPEEAEEVDTKGKKFAEQEKQLNFINAYVNEERIFFE